MSQAGSPFFLPFDLESGLVFGGVQAEEFLEGKSYYAIGQGLTADGIRTAALLPVFKANVEKIVSCSNSAEAAALDEKMIGLQRELLKKADARQDYEDITRQIDAIRDEKQRLLLEDARKEGTRRQIQQIRKFLDEQTEMIEEYDETLVRRLIEKITVYDDRLVIEFKSWMEIDVV